MTIDEAKEILIYERPGCANCGFGDVRLIKCSEITKCRYAKALVTMIETVEEYEKGVCMTKEAYSDLCQRAAGLISDFKEMLVNIDYAIKATDEQDDYSMGMRNGMRYVKSLIDDKEPQYELRRTDEEIKLGIDIGDEVVGDYGTKGVVVGIDTYKDEVWLSLLMGNHKVPQLVKASGYKTKTGRHFPQVIEVLDQMKGESDGK